MRARSNSQARSRRFSTSFWLRVLFMSIFSVMQTIFTVFGLSFATAQGHFERSEILAVNATTIGLSMFVMPFAARLSADLGKPVKATADWRSCVEGADIVVEAGACFRGGADAVLGERERPLVVLADLRLHRRVRERLPQVRDEVVGILERVQHLLEVSESFAVFLNFLLTNAEASVSELQKKMETGPPPRKPDEGAQ